jgi:hypothetical protein
VNCSEYVAAAAVENVIEVDEPLPVTVMVPLEGAAV